MTTQLRSERVRDEMRRLFAGKATKHEVMKALGLSSSSYHRHLSAIRDEDQEWVKALAMGEFVSEFRLAWESLEELQRRLRVVEESCGNAHDKIEAIRLAREIEKDRLTLLAEGPTALAVLRSSRRSEKAADVQNAA